VLYEFSAISGFYQTTGDGAFPRGILILSGDSLYGTASGGGIWGNGTVFRLMLPVPELTITPSGSNIVLMWPANLTGITLQSSPNLVAPVWTANASAPVVVNGQNTVTNPITGTQQFFRLSQ
jgi:uncharacterized repeat protein (TIGR03803 family)